MNELSVKDLILEHNYASESYTLTFDGHDKVALNTKNIGWLNQASFVISNDQFNRTYLIDLIAKFISEAEYAPAFNDAGNEEAVEYTCGVANHLPGPDLIKSIDDMFAEHASSCSVMYPNLTELEIGEVTWSLQSKPMVDKERNFIPVVLDNCVASLHLNFNKPISVYEMVKSITDDELEDGELMKRMDLTGYLRDDTFSKDDLSNTVAVYRTDGMHAYQRIELAIKFARYYPKQSFIILDAEPTLKGGLDRSKEAMAKFKEDDYENLTFVKTSGLSL